MVFLFWRGKYEVCNVRLRSCYAVTALDLDPICQIYFQLRPEKQNNSNLSRAFTKTVYDIWRENREAMGDAIVLNLKLIQNKCDCFWFP